jgi:poly(3-hydroxybutyrate) depolymerase
VQSIEVQATTRDFIVKLPASYDPNHPHPLVLGFHPNSSSAGDVAGAPLLGGYYGLEDLASADGVDVVFIAPEGIDGGWANTGGRDVAFVEQMLDALAAELCIDESRIFSVGFSYGAIMSYSLACAMGDRIRAIAAMSGGLLGGCVDGDVPVAVWSSHGTSDQTLSLSSGEAARDEFVVRNGCGSQTMATTPSPCVSHQGCDPGYPVTWCEFNGDHVTPSWAPQAIWDFFLQF